MGTISFSCACGATVSVGDNLAGKKGYCPQCKKPIVVPKGSATAPAAGAAAKP
ncbi:hypothetical protein HY251_03760, partial [bacterium]|nr:hypothetical protein [bacterium]